MVDKTSDSQNRKVLQRLLDAEKEAREKIEDARSKADDIIKEAEEEADSIIEKAREDAEAEAEKIIREAGENVSEKQDESFSGQVFMDIESFRKRAEDNMDRAVKLLTNWVTGKEEPERD